MTSRSPKVEPNRQIVDEASAWFVDFRTGDIDAQAREEFNAWLRRSPEHIQAYFEVARTYAELTPPDEIDVPGLIARGRADRGDDNVIPLVARASAPRTQEGRAHRGAKRLWIAAAVCIAVAALGTWVHAQRDVYSTDVGEQRSIALGDGSVVELNALSRIRVRFDEQARDVDLLQGQALFRVEHDSARPFVVHSGETRIRALGTQFDVYRRATGTTVTVLEGRVSVAGKELSAGQQVCVTSTVAPLPARANIATATAWTQRQLVFDNSSLSDVAEEFNRYSVRRMTVYPRGLDDFHVSGMYSSSNTESLLRFLRAQPGITVRETSEGIGIAAKN